MSGLAAISKEGTDKILAEMVEKIKHRGPEYLTTFKGETVQMAELNLSKEKAEQDTEEGKGVIFDGTPILGKKPVSRAEIKQKYKIEGPDFVKKLEGDFAIIIADGEDFYAARDLLGTKPLYYSINGGVHFSSEMKSLTNSGSTIETFPPGHYYTKAGIKKYKDIPAVTSANENEQELEKTTKGLKKILMLAIERALKEENNVYTFLSGGLDSSIITAAAQKISDKKVTTFAVGVENSKDILNARIVAQYLETEHHEYIYGPAEIFKVLPQVIYHLESFDVELVNSSIANFFAAGMARHHGAELVFSGEGADELFAGYHHLKEYKTEADLNKELTNLLSGLHSGGLQRVDRMTQAHSLECKMPFMDFKVMKYALSLPAKYKVSADGVEKWILRKAFSEELPDEIVWRTKSQFGIGTGNEELMKDMIEEKVSDEEFKQAQEVVPLELKSKEEYLYYKIFKTFYPEKSIETTVNRWLM